jgi:hypothetical protein
MLSQLQDNQQWHPVAFFSKTMDQAEFNYQIHNKEILVIIRSFEHWHAELEGAILPVQVISDHKALKVFMTTKALTARQAHWADTLSCFNFWIVYSPGQTNQVDTLTCRGQDNIDCTDW